LNLDHTSIPPNDKPFGASNHDISIAWRHSPTLKKYNAVLRKPGNSANLGKYKGFQPFETSYKEDSPNTTPSGPGFFHPK